MFTRFASDSRPNQTYDAHCVVDTAAATALRIEFENLFRTDMDSFTRFVMERSARTAHRQMAFAA